VSPDPTSGAFTFPLTVRYMEVDAQGVVFNAWYLTYFDEAMSAFLTARGLPYQKMIEAGFDVQLVRSEIDWRSGLRWQDTADVAVSTARIGRTSFALDFEVIATDGSGKRPIPPALEDALGEPAPLRDS
jgi:acyl-CoA thioester hydrolase